MVVWWGSSKAYACCLASCQPLSAWWSPLSVFNWLAPSTLLAIIGSPFSLLCVALLPATIIQYFLLHSPQLDKTQSCRFPKAGNLSQRSLCTNRSFLDWDWYRREGWCWRGLYWTFQAADYGCACVWARISNRWAIFPSSIGNGLCWTCCPFTTGSCCSYASDVRTCLMLAPLQFANTWFLLVAQCFIAKEKRSIAIWLRVAQRRGLFHVQSCSPLPVSQQSKLITLPSASERVPRIPVPFVMTHHSWGKTSVYAKRCPAL